MPSYSSIYGLSVQSNEPIPGVLNLETRPLSVDLHIQLGNMPSWLKNSEMPTRQWYTGAHPGIDEKPTLMVWKMQEGKYFNACYADGTQFVINRVGTEIWANWPPDTLTLEDTATYLLGPVMGFILLLRGFISLHASAIILGNEAVALVGPAGAGKSTTAAAFANSGSGILAEDVVTLDDRGDTIFVRPAYPCIRLWPASVEALYGPGASLPKLTPNWDKRYLDLTQEQFRFGEDALPLSAIYLLTARTQDQRAPFVRQLPTAKALIALIANTYTTYLMDKSMRARAFKLFGRVLTQVPVKELIPHSDPANIGKMCDLIIKDFGGSKAAEPMPSNQGPEHV